jgi:hypothetical protein
MRPAPSSRTVSSRSASAHRSQIFPLVSSPSMPHRQQVKSRVMPPQSRQMAVPSASPGSSRAAPQRGQRPGCGTRV